MKDYDYILDEQRDNGLTVCAKCFREVPLADTVKMVGEKSGHVFRWCHRCADKPARERVA